MSKKKNNKFSSILPEKFLGRLEQIVGVSLSGQIIQTFAERPTTFRVNTIKAQKEEIIEVLNQNGFKFERVLWYKGAFILKNKTKRELTDLDIYKEGKIYIQSLASMVPPIVLDPQPGEKILDLTAAPGSKTSQIAALMQKTGELVANDDNKVRFFKLKHNMEALGVANTPHPDLTSGHPSLEGSDTNQDENQIISGDYSPLTPLSPREGSQTIQDWKFTLRMEHGSALTHEYPEYFDKILLDAPCSAEARFVVGKPESTGYWKESKIKEMAYKQRKLLFSAWSALKPGGILVYSTCTFAPEENELQITKFLESVDNAELLETGLSELKRLSIIKNWHNKEINKEVIKKGFRIMPTKEIEGFFVVKMKKKLGN